MIFVESSFHGDPAPPSPAGPTDALWNYEVVELMLLGDDGRYLEIEIGPHGHYLALQLHGVRNVTCSGMPMFVETSIQDDRFIASARVPARWLPPGLKAANAYAIHGAGPGRRYLACYPTGGEQPDFHRLAHFGTLR